MDALLILCSGVGVGMLMGFSISPTLHIIFASVTALVVGIVSALAGLEVKPGDSDNKEEVGAELQLGKRKGVVKVNPLPLTMLIIGLVIGSCVGIYVRTNELLGVSPRRIAERWKDTGLDEKEIYRRIFDQMYPARPNSASNNKPPSSSAASQEQSLAPPQTEPAGSSPPAGDAKPGAPQALRSTAPEEASKAPPNPVREMAQQPVLYSLTAQECDMVSGEHGLTLRNRLKGFHKKYIDDVLKKCTDDQCLESLKARLCPD
jgi:hypothetical protein